jgi:hypothetical protein
MRMALSNMIRPRTIVRNIAQKWGAQKWGQPSFFVAQLASQPENKRAKRVHPVFSREAQAHSRTTNGSDPIFIFSCRGLP